MEFTKFVVESRDKALLYGDYSSYRTQLGHRLLTVRKKLGVATRHRGKYTPKGITPEQVAHNVNHVWLQVLTAERAFAQAMAIKAAHAANATGVTGSARAHIASRLDKASKIAERLAETLQDPASSTEDTTVLEARAYAALLRGACAFEKQAWTLCLANYAAVWGIYKALSTTPGRADTFRDLLADTLEPSLRYAAYQLKVPRSKPIAAIARDALLAAHHVAASPDTRALVAEISAIDPGVLEATDDKDDSETTSTRTLTWRGRAVHVEDASIASAWTALDQAKSRLAATLASGRLSARDQAAAYEDVLTVAQDAVDATKAAIDDLRAEGVPASDPSVQLLYVARTAANYEMISDRIGRNRVLTGPHDGALAHLEHLEHPAAKARDTPGRRIARLKEKVVLYDGTLQSLDAIKELPGVAADDALAAKMDATSAYFGALKALAIARSHTLAGHPTNALALLQHAHDRVVAAAAVANLADADTATATPGLLSLDVAPADVHFLADLLAAELQRARAVVDMHAQLSVDVANVDTLGDSLAEYPPAVDLDNIVAYPPRLTPMPIKPILLDIAWNYIDYPKGGAGAGAGAAAGAVAAKTDAPPEQKRGWFGFKR